MTFPRFLAAVFLGAVLFLPGAARAQRTTAPPLPADPAQFLRDVVKNELAADAADISHWSYRLHREDEKNNYDRLVIESKDGELARTILWFGKPLTADLLAKDEERMHK